MSKSSVQPSSSEAQQPATASRKLYASVEEYIAAEIRAGNLKSGSRLGSMDDIAAILNVSPGTVRHSLQNMAAKGILVRRPRAGTFVAEIAAEATGAAADAGTGASAGRSVRSTPIIVLLIPDVRRPEYAGVAHAVQESARALDADVVVSSTGDADVDVYENTLRRQLAGGGQPYGVILVPPLYRSLSLEVLGELQARQVPVVTLFRAIPSLEWPTVTIDFHHNIELAAQHLCDIGRKRIALATIAEASELTYLKHYAFLRAVMAAGQMPQSELLLTVPMPLEPTREMTSDALRAIDAWLKAHPKIDGVCCVHYELALGVIDCLKSLGRRVPEDVAVVGTGNFARAYGLAPRTLTTVDARPDRMGEVACDVLRRLREGERFPEGWKQAIAGELIIGQSSAPAPSSSSSKRS